jgi:hypothetical protein
MFQQTVITVSETVIMTGMRVRARAAGTRAWVRGRKRVRIQRVFSKKKLTDPSQTRTRLPAYTRARIRVPRVPDTDTQIRVIPGGF